MKAELTEFITLARVRAANLHLKVKLANPVRRLKEEVVMLITFGWRHRSDSDVESLTVNQHVD